MRRASTARVTTLGGIRTGHQVNLERALRADSRFGGHFVQGHVDATGTVKAIRDESDAHWLTVTFEEALAAYLIPKGSIAIDGVSLTIAALRDAEFDVMIIPFTWSTRICMRARPATALTWCDMVGKYVARAAQAYVGAAGQPARQEMTTKTQNTHYRRRARFASTREAIEPSRRPLIIVVDDEERENEGDLTMAASAITGDAVNSWPGTARGLICLALMPDRA